MIWSHNNVTDAELNVIGNAWANAPGGTQQAMPTRERR